MSYTPTHISDGNVLTPASINDELDAIAAEYNAIDGSTIQNGTVPLVALATQNAYYTLDLRDDAIAGGDVVGTIQDLTVVPVAGTNTSTLVGVVAVCQTCTPGEQIDVYKETGGAATVLSAVITLAALTAASGTVSTTAFSKDDVLSLRSIGNGGAATKVRVVLLFKTALQT